MAWERKLAAFAVVVLLGLSGLLAYCTPALPHDHWINWGAYVDPTHPQVHCCGIADCPTVLKEQVQSTPAGWLIVPTGEVVPYSETYPSEDGLFYRCHRRDGSRRCFFAPPAGS